ncbi:MAG: hypothetical protein EOP83_04325 [Verrucomicrobiaceae bacterium]|nr:MAG: hypothetical protein EOP83_04325 [Verrucomicrobiaceae bacterium]
MDSPAEIHVTAVKRVLKYLKGTMTYSIFFDSKVNDLKFYAYSDADYAGDLIWLRRLIRNLDQINPTNHRERVAKLVDAWEEHVDPRSIHEVAHREVTAEMLDEIHFMLRCLLKASAS